MQAKQNPHAGHIWPWASMCDLWLRNFRKATGSGPHVVGFLDAVTDLGGRPMTSWMQPFPGYMRCPLNNSLKIRRSHVKCLSLLRELEPPDLSPWPFDGDDYYSVSIWGTKGNLFISHFAVKYLRRFLKTWLLPLGLLQKTVEVGGRKQTGPEFLYVPAAFLLLYIRHLTWSLQQLHERGIITSLWEMEKSVWTRQIKYIVLRQSLSQAVVVRTLRLGVIIATLPLRVH